MVKSALLKRGNLFLSLLMMGTAALAFSFKAVPDNGQLLTWSNKCLLHLFDPDATDKLKKWDLTVTGDNFLRLNKYYQGGKQEYYSFHLRRFKDVGYLGTSAAGILRLQTNEDDVIVQTYHDPKGNIDSMATYVDLPVRNAEPEELDSLRTALLQLKGKR